jgi:hypothetical protein
MVIGIGGAGCNSINRLVETNIRNVEIVAANTDVQALRTSRAPIKMEIGMKLTRGLGCGGDPQLGRQAALEETERILELLQGFDMVFIAGGGGGGTFTGGAPVFAGLASEIGALTYRRLCRKSVLSEFHEECPKSRCLYWRRQWLKPLWYRREIFSDRHRRRVRLQAVLLSPACPPTPECVRTKLYSRHLQHPSAVKRKPKFRSPRKQHVLRLQVWRRTCL